ncbi:MAG: DUF6115 domain-containing protein [Lachnospiraceae bacterium]
MGAVQIIILIVGAVLFTVSFLIPERKSDNRENAKKEEKFIKEALEREMASFRYQLEDAAQDSVEHTKETTERYMDRITNEKMMAINEYSDTVLEQIHKNHEEAMFLYDMLNNKHAQIKNTAAELNDTIKTAKHAQTVATEKKPEAEKQINKPQEKKTGEIHFEPIVAQKAGKTPVTKTKTQTKKNKEIEVMFDSDNTETNSNERILALHKAGKSNMAIAKELGLGIGEVKLVIDLFEGI